MTLITICRSRRTGSNRRRQHRNEVLIEVPGRTRRRRLTVLNKKADYDRFVETLATYREPVVAGFEATGNYHRPLAHRLLAAEIELRLISSLALARTREAITNGWDSRRDRGRSAAP